MLKIYTGASGSFTTNYAGWSFIVDEPNPIVNYCGCTGGTFYLMQDMAIYQAMMWARANGRKEFILFGTLGMSGLAKVLVEEFPELDLQMPPKDELNDFCEALAEKGRVKVQGEKIGFQDIEINDMLMNPDELFSTRYLVKEKFKSSLILQNISTVSKKLEIWESDIKMVRL